MITGKIKKMTSILLSGIMALGMLTAVPFTAGATETTEDGLTIMPTDVDTASEGCVMMGLKGSYITQIQESLDLINSYRLEACREGFENPDTGEALTLDDYVPIKWSSDLECIARIRAAESSITGAHVRLNGKQWYEISAPDGTSRWGEVLAWNNSKTMTKGIEQWYSEKSDWESGNKSYAGHYEAMIKPSNTYVGLGTFYSESTDFYNTTAGRFSNGEGLDETQGTAVDSCIQLVEVSANYITDYDISLADESGSCLLSAAVKYGSEKAVTLRVMDGVVWSSSNPDVAIDENGVLSSGAGGTTTVTASVLGSTVAQAEVTVEASGSEPTTSEPDTQPSSVMLGDTNGDGKITIADATAIQKYLASIEEFTDEQKTAANVDGNDTVSIMDVTVIQKYIAQIISEFPAAK